MNTVMSGPGPDVGEVPPGDAAVAAHIILNELALTAGRAATLRERWERVPAEVRHRWLTEMAETATRTSAVFHALAQGHGVTLDHT